jgi:UDP-N-acetylmuramoyl-L-alanyl-D-glutamate--2,6-diaminopimelate ligase
MRLFDLVKGVANAQYIQDVELEITGIAYHSARVEEGDLFVAVPGYATDGHEYISEALERGARALMVMDPGKLPDDLPAGVAAVRVRDARAALARVADLWHHHPSGRLKLVGITGTNGKTTTAFLVDSICRAAGMTTGLVGTVTYRIGDEELPVARTTPEAPDLQKMFERMIDEGVEVAAMEVSSHALDLHRVDGCEFAAAVFTNLSQDHLDWHRDMEQYYLAKRKLFRPAPQDAIVVHRAAINIDDDYGRRLMGEKKMEALTFGTGTGCDLRGEFLQQGLKDSRVRLSYAGREREFETSLVGDFNLYNMLAATAAALQLGLDLDQAVAGIVACPGVPGRFQAVRQGQDFAVIVDYAHTPDSLAKALQSARRLTRGRVITVFGCGGDRDRGKRPLMGRHAGELSDFSVITSDNPRSEDPDAIISQIEAGLRETRGSESYEVQPDRRAAIAQALAQAGHGDVVLIAGKGHEQGQTFADRVVPFDDYTVACELLREMKR